MANANTSLFHRIPHARIITVDLGMHTNEFKVSIPLERAGNLLLLEAQIGDQKGYFVFDTGAPYLVLNKSYFRKHFVQRDVTGNGITGNTSEIGRAEIDSLHMGLISYSGIEADIVGLGHIENARGVQIFGLLGLNLFSSFDVEIDLNQNLLSLYVLDKKGRRKDNSSFSHDLTLPIKCDESGMVVQGLIGKKKLNFAFDTGAEINALNNTLDSEILKFVQISGRSFLMGVGEERIEILIGTLNSLKIGSIDFLRMKTIITPLQSLEDAYGRKIDGILGFEFLKQGVICINPKTEELRMRLFNNFNRQE